MDGRKIFRTSASIAKAIKEWNAEDLENGVRTAKLELEEANQRDRFYRLVSEADIYFNNHRPGWRERFGISNAALRAHNPTPLGQYIGVTEMVEMSKTPGDYRYPLTPIGSWEPGWL